MNSWFKVLIFILLFIPFLFSSCKSKDKLHRYETIKSIDEDVLVNNILVNELKYHSLYFKRLTIDFDENGNSRSVRANMYIKRDSSIIISIIPLMGIEIFRVSLDNNAIRVIDRLNRKVLVSDYKKLSERFFVEVNYQIIEGLITNSLFSYPEHNPELIKDYAAYHQDSFYSLRSLNMRQYERLSKRNSDLFFHQINILPGIYKINENRIINTLNQILFVTEYKSFNTLGNTQFPFSVNINAKQGNHNYKLIFTYSDIEIDGSNSMNFRIPEKYEIVSF